MMKKLLGAVLTLVLTFGCLTPAFANHRHPPRAILKAPHSWQKGVLGSYCWNYVDKGSDEGVGFCADTFSHDFPEPDETTTGAAATIRLWVAKLPKEVSVDVWREVDERGEPIGESERLAVTIEPHRKDGEIVAYDARFTLPATAGEVYLTAFARWGTIRYGDGRADGDAFYDFHLTTQ